MSVALHYVDGKDGKPSVLTVYLKGKPYPLTQEHPCYGQVKKILATATEDELFALLDVDNAVKAFVASGGDGKAEVRNGVVYYDGAPVHNAVATRIVEHMRAGLDFKNLLRFLERVSKNPSYQSQKELFDFLDRKGLPITEDGCFLGYKAVRSDFKDKHSGTIDNSPGRVVKMARHLVDDNRGNHCSAGLHVGHMDYVVWYGGHEGKVVVVKVDPEHCVSVPTDHQYMKLRTCQYEVLHEYTGLLTDVVYSERGEAVPSVLDDGDFDWSFCEDDDYNEDDDYEDESSDVEDDDEFDSDDVTSEPACGNCGCTVTSQPQNNYLGIKPPGGAQAGRPYHNKREKGRFAPKQ